MSLVPTLTSAPTTYSPEMDLAHDLKKLAEVLRLPETKLRLLNQYVPRRCGGPDERPTPFSP